MSDEPGLGMAGESGISANPKRKIKSYFAFFPSILLIYLRDGERETHTENSLLQSSQQSEQDGSQEQELEPGLLPEWQDPDCLGHFCCPPGFCSSRKLSQEPESTVKPGTPSWDVMTSSGNQAWSPKLACRPCRLLSESGRTLGSTP